MTFDSYLERHPIAKNAFGLLYFILKLVLWLAYSIGATWIVLLTIVCQISCYIMATYFVYALCEWTGWIISPFMFVLWAHATHWFITEQYPAYLKDVWRAYYDHIFTLKF